MRHTILKVLHVLALGMWFGGAAFFNFVAAPTIFDTFKQVAEAGPSDRTAGETIIPPDASAERKKNLGSALAGSAVGPVFPKYFAMQAVCGLVALATALNWWGTCGAIHRLRIVVVGLAVLTVAAGWPLSNYVSELRLLRFDPNPDIKSAAVAAFGPWHLASLGLSFVTVCLAGVALALAAKLPAEARAATEGGPYKG